jgi:nucleotide-binding universal stress UspA family protein
VPAITRILCPVDFSDASAHAVEQAVAIARWSGATLTALNVEQPIFMPVPALPAPVDRVSDPRISTVCDRTKAFIEPAAAAGVSTTVCVEIGDPVTKILERAASLHADLIVMGTHGASGFEHLVLGSVAEKILRKASCAVLTVPPRAHTTSVLPFRRIVCAVDFSAWSTEALGLAGALARQPNVSLDVVHVIEWPWDEPPQPDLRQLPLVQACALIELRRDLEDSATNRLQMLIAAAVPDDCVAEAHVRHGKAHVEILRVAVERHADLIVLGVHGRQAIDMALFGSTTNQVVRRARCPVLTLRR